MGVTGQHQRYVVLASPRQLIGAVAEQQPKQFLTLLIDDWPLIPWVLVPDQQRRHATKFASQSAAPQVGPTRPIHGFAGLLRVDDACVVITQNIVAAITSTPGRENLAKPINTWLLVDDITRQGHQMRPPLGRTLDRVPSKVWVYVASQMNIR
jgi:hypothetical protein